MGARCRGEPAQNLNSRSLTVTDHGIQAMPRGAVERVEDHWPRFSRSELGHGAQQPPPEIDESL